MKSDTIRKETEMQHRYFGCEVIQEAIRVLELPQIVALTGQMLLHRFYRTRSVQQYACFPMAMACLFLASKLEEETKRIREILNGFYFILQCRQGNRKGATATLDESLFTIWKDDLIQNERQLLIDLGFGLYRYMDYPHKYILYFLRVLDGTSTIAQYAWNYVNDSFRMDACIRYKPQVLACAAIQLAFERQGDVLLPKAWYELFDTKLDDMEKAKADILSIYDTPPILWLNSIANEEYSFYDIAQNTVKVHSSQKAHSSEKATTSVKQRPRSTKTVAEIVATLTQQPSRKKSRFSPLKRPTK